MMTRFNGPCRVAHRGARDVTAEALSSGLVRELHRRRMERATEIDFSVFDLDATLPEITTNGERGSLDKFAQWGSGKTLRQLVAERVDRSIELVGTPDQVAERMGEGMDEVGGDGFLITNQVAVVPHSSVFMVLNDPRAGVGGKGRLLCLYSLIPSISMLALERDATEVYSSVVSASPQNHSTTASVRRADSHRENKSC
jgi:hypothetical protein